MPSSWYSKTQMDTLLTAAKARGVHTGTQTAATISDFVEVAQDAIAALLVGASGVTLSYDDTGNTLTITGGGTGGGLDAEAVRDTIGVAMVGMGLINIVVNDAADTITITTSATANSTDAFLRDRGNHTGAQATSTITGLDVALSGKATTAQGAKADTAVQPAALASKADLVGGVIPTAQMPSISLTNAVPVANQAAMLALTSAQVQPGDVAVRSDGAGTFMLTAANPAVLASWTLLNAPTDTVSSVNGQTGTVSLGKADFNLANVNDTADVNKPVSGPQQQALDDLEATFPTALAQLSGTITTAQVAPRTMMVVLWSGTAWPSSPAGGRTDISLMWVDEVGNSTNPPIVAGRGDQYVKAVV